MDFNEFVLFLPKISSSKLNGIDSHLKKAPLERKKIMESLNLEAITPRNACVLMLIYPKNDKATLAFIVRTSYNGAHSSQIAFPGGKVEEEDISLEATALRETFEEIGINAEKISIIRPFTEIYVPPSNFMVYPFLGFSTNNLSFTLDPKEVAGIVEWSISELLNDDNCIVQKMATSYSENIVAVPAFQVNEHVVWGATAMIVNELKELLQEII